MIRISRPTHHQEIQIHIAARQLLLCCAYLMVMVFLQEVVTATSVQWERSWARLVSGMLLLAQLRLSCKGCIGKVSICFFLE
jgi:hypothetical protein